MWAFLVDLTAVIPLVIFPLFLGALCKKRNTILIICAIPIKFGDVSAQIATKIV